MKTKKQTYETMDISASTEQRDINEALECKGRRKVDLCAEKVSFNRALMDQLGEGTYHVRIDAGHITFNYDGYRWVASTPKVVKNALIMFDDPKKYGRDAVRPHRFKVHAIKSSKIAKASPQRKAKINAARRARVLSGAPDRKYPSLRQRIIGYQ